MASDDDEIDEDDGQEQQDATVVNLLSAAAKLSPEQLAELKDSAQFKALMGIKRKKEEGKLYTSDLGAGVKYDLLPLDELNSEYYDTRPVPGLGACAYHYTSLHAHRAHKHATCLSGSSANEKRGGLLTLRTSLFEKTSDSGKGSLYKYRNDPTKKETHCTSIAKIDSTHMTQAVIKLQKHTMSEDKSSCMSPEQVIIHNTDLCIFDRFFSQAFKFIQNAINMARKRINREKKKPGYDE